MLNKTSWVGLPVQIRHPIRSQQLLGGTLGHFQLVLESLRSITTHPRRHVGREATDRRTRRMLDLNYRPIWVQLVTLPKRVNPSLFSTACPRHIRIAK